jgi:hypothetical protein
VDRAATAVDGTFTFHLLEGHWEIDMENLPGKYKIVSMTRRFTLAKGSASLTLQIAVQ